MLLFLFFSFASCNFLSKDNDQKDEKASGKRYFEGEIKLSESRGYQGSLFKVYTTYLISENKIKREQKAKGLNAVFNMKNGIIVDLAKDSVTLYYSDVFQKNKHLLSVKEYDHYLKTKNHYSQGFSPIDGTFTFLSTYEAHKTVKDSSFIQGFMTDYTLYIDNIFQQEIFDTKDIKVKRELLEMVFYQLPKEINFPLRSEFKSIISSVKNDSLIHKTVQLKDKISKDILHKTDITNTDMLTKNKWLDLGIKALKKGVDIALHATLKIESLSEHEIKLSEFSIPSGDFKEIDDIDTFFSKLPSGGDFDD